MHGLGLYYHCARGHAGRTPTPGRGGFSLLELLAVIAILALLVGILIPVVTKARTAAMKVVCLNRLKDLALATRTYQTEQRYLPEPLTTASSSNGTITLTPSPQMVHTRLLGRLEKYLRHPAVKPTTSLNDLPPQLQCPFVENSDQRGPFATLDPGAAQFYTGYSYLGRIEEPPQPSAELLSLFGLALPQIHVGVALKTDRAAPAQLQKRGVVWADDVHWEADSGGFWQYGHARARAPAGPKPRTKKDAAMLAGQHRAFTDGSVEWVTRDEMAVPTGGASPSQLDLSASFKIGSSSYWWY